MFSLYKLIFYFSLAVSPSFLPFDLYYPSFFFSYPSVAFILSFFPSFFLSSFTLYLFIYLYIYLYIYLFNISSFLSFSPLSFFLSFHLASFLLYFPLFFFFALSCVLLHSYQQVFTCPRDPSIRFLTQSHSFL